jgi:AMIN domain
MKFPLRTAGSLLLWAAVYLTLSVAAPVTGHAQDVTSIRSVQVLGKQNPVEIEIEANNRLTPQVQVLTDPDRLVVDFPNAVPGAQLRNQTLNRQEIKSMRAGLFASNPPTTRIVFDLNGPQLYQIFPAGRTVIIKVGSPGADQAASPPASGTSSGAKLVSTTYSVGSVRITPPVSLPLVVSFQSGLLTIIARQATLSEVLFAVHLRTGAEIAIPAGSEQEQVVGEIGPAPAPEVLSRLLNGSKFNFMILSSPTEPGVIDRVILSPRPEGGAPASMPLQQVVQAAEEPEADAPSRTPPPTPNPDPQGSQGNPEQRTPDNVPN